jgi:hypothetical protein
MNGLLETIKDYGKEEYDDIYEEGHTRHFVETFLYKERGIWEMRKGIHEALLDWVATQIHVTGCDEDLAKELATDLLSIDVYEQRLIKAIYDLANAKDFVNDDDW